jgi:hypothetical protein
MAPRDKRLLIGLVIFLVVWLLGRLIGYPNATLIIAFCLLVLLRVLWPYVRPVR